ncbi:Uncharacterized protein SCF082_LOCUS3343, partial [Durusdinium trenchii]
VGVCDAVWKMIRQHLDVNRFDQRIEDKMDAKKLYAESITLRTPRDLLPWTPEHMYVVPTGRDAVPHASEGVRSLSDVQETAQLLAGEALPQSVIASLLKGSEAHSLIGVVNLTPYEGNLELSMIKSSIEKQMHTFRSLSLSTDLTLIQHCERECAMFLFEDPDWKRGGKTMGNVRPYDPTPPPVDKVDLSSYPLKLAKLSLNNKAKGIKKYVIELSNEVRGLHLENPLFAPQWRSLIQDFDKKFCGGSGSCPDPSNHPAAPVEDAAPKPFSLEPDTLEGLLEQYVVENKVPAREPGCMLMLTSAKRRDGSSVEMLVSHQDFELGCGEFQLAHGKSSWLSREKYQKLMREGGGLVLAGTLVEPC